MLVSGMQGLGDNIYQRAVLREIKEPVHLRTSWPQLYHDLPNIKSVMSKTRLRTQLKNIQRLGGNAWSPDQCGSLVKLSYSAHDLVKSSILQIMSSQLNAVPKVFDLPKFKRPDIEMKYAVVRPCTLRSEWCNHSRGPLSEYVSQAAEILREKGFYTVSVADLQGTAEWADGELPKCDLEYNHGELGIEDLMGLIQGASVVVGGVGWITPASIAADVPLITILGGLGGFNAPERVTCPPMDTSKAYWIYPDKYCYCTDMRHACNKKITDFRSKFSKICSKVL